MSHFSVLVCLPADTALEHLETRLGEIMAQWDENLSVSRHRVYEEGPASDHWWVSSLRRSASNHQALTELGPETFIDHKVSQLQKERLLAHREIRGKVQELVHKGATEWAEDAAWAAKLPDPVTWESVVTLYNARHHPHDALVTVRGDLADDDGDRLHYDPEIGTAYTWSTRNLESKWDYWRIGGRWRGHFLAKGPGAGLITTPEDWDSPAEPEDRSARCDGGPKLLLDFEAMREQAATQADTDYDQWEAVCDGTPTAKPWSHFGELAKAKYISIDDARAQYGDQPRIVKARRTGLDSFWGGCVVERFLPDRAEYVALARAAAIPGYALVTLDRQWVAPGHMGWFGTSSDGPGERESYNAAVNLYLDELHDSDFVVVLDCHT